MPSDLQVSNIKDLTGSNTGLSIASDGQVTISQNNPSITLGSNATFPSGHVVQTIHQTFNNDATGITSYTTAPTHIEKNITITAGNKVAFNFCIPTRHKASGYAYGQFQYYIYHKVGSSGTYAEMNSGKYQANYYFDQDGNLPVDFYRYFNVQMSGVHTPSSGTEQYYKVYGKLVQGNDIYVGLGTSIDTTVILQEIQL